MPQQWWSPYWQQQQQQQHHAALHCRLKKQTNQCNSLVLIRSNGGERCVRHVQDNTFVCDSVLHLSNIAATLPLAADTKCR